MVTLNKGIAQTLQKVYADKLDTIEKKQGLISTLSHRNRQSTGLLVSDLLLGGGFVPAMYSIAGPEASAKSTALMTALGATMDSVPIESYFDAEGSVDPNYTGNIIKVKDLTEVFGLRTKKGWAIPPKARYYDEFVISKIFDTMVAVLNQLPNKRYFPEEDLWAFTFDRTKRSRGIMSDLKVKPDKSLSTRYGASVCPVDDEGLQAIFIVDSWAALLADVVEDSEEANNAMALNAREFSTHLKRVVGKLRRKAAVIYGANQIRLKPMVMYGCLAHNSKILLADGTTKTIKEIVDKKLSVSVLSVNPKTGLIEPKKVVGWFNNGSGSDARWLRIRTDHLQHGRGGKADLKVTENHYVRCYNGLIKQARWLKVGDRLEHIPTVKSLSDYDNGREYYKTFATITSIEEDIIAGDKYDLQVEDNHNYIADGIAVLNSPEYESGGEALKFYSSVRNQIRARSCPPSWGKGAVGEEPSVYGKGVDRYQYKAIKNTKNKTFTPYMEGWTRVWISDHNNQGRGFCPAYDTYQYLLMTGQLKGNLKKFVVQLPGLENVKFDWFHFKKLVLADALNDRKLAKEAASELHLKKIVRPNKLCFDQLRTGKFADLLIKANENKYEDVDTDEDYEDE